MKYELYGNYTLDGGMTWRWWRLSTHKTRDAAIKEAVRRGPGFRKMKIHTVDIENLPRWFTHVRNRR